ncbi:hypothetical protein C8A00DRAFT_36134 [Chaetomidium leptoderma]|uniref:Uncharacterized protein n=1 Tax=Chaetomidium leptoderma TaxID=669021 RepID=A0AAN6VHJ3_9PEZI|nr:hypothetical protein C8A00DRAFT_36134 [Chaetomidium leptoderma]
MLSILAAITPLGLLIQGVSGGQNDVKRADSTHVDVSTIRDCVTVFDTKTVEVTHYIDVSINRTHTNIVTSCITELTTTTLHYTVSVTQTASAIVTTTDTDSVTVTNTATNLTTITNTQTDSVTVINTDTDLVTITDTETDSVTVTNTDTDSVTITNTETDSVTITDTDTTTTTVPTTTYTTRTVFSTTVDPCPKECSISAETVNLYFWPTDRPFSYPSTYVHPELAYTFTSPSVYMLIPTAVGTNPQGQPTGPSTSRWILPLDLDEVSTIAANNATRQLTLSDLGTDCPQTADPTAIATLVDGRWCDPVLAAPSQVRSWAYPCNACGRFGLFDPPYAVPTLTGDLVEPVPTTTTTRTTVGVATTTSSSTPVVTVTAAPSSGPTSVAGLPDTGVTGVPSQSFTSTPTGVATAAGARYGVEGGGGMWLMSGVVVVVYWLY